MQINGGMSAYQVTVQGTGVREITKGPRGSALAASRSSPDGGWRVGGGRRERGGRQRP